jgi:phosphoglycerate dehydrogenase-like enzyme
VSLTRSLERWPDTHVWALHNVLCRPHCVAWSDDILAEVLLEMHRRGVLQVQELREGKWKKPTQPSGLVSMYQPPHA